MIRQEETIVMQPASRPPKLLVLEQGQIRELDLSGYQTLGRVTSGNSPDLPLVSSVVSRQHGVFLTDENGCRYQDVCSANGTIAEGMLMQPRTPILLKDGDILRIHGKKDTGHTMDVVLVYITNYHEHTEWKRVHLTDQIAEIAVGRQEQVQLMSPAVSRRHASFFQAQAGWAIIDHGSRNGVFVNGNRLGAPAYLSPLDVVRIADYLFFYTGDSLVFQADTAEPEPAAIMNPSSVIQTDQNSRPSGYESGRVSQPSGYESSPAAAPDVLSVWIEERNVWQRAKKKTLLKDIRLDITSGSMVLILGGSGAGKTTFINAVMGYEQAEGQILYNGTDIYKEYARMKYEIAYVPQDDLLRLNDTVYDTLRNAADMRLPVDLSSAQLAERVDTTIRILGLDRVRDSLVGKLSGGQRKRLSIAVEYIGDPKLFFLDEPDSGLDAGNAQELMHNLRTIADDNRIVMVISHSPDRAAELFDSVIVLAKDSRDDSGHLVYYGPPKDACAFFGVETLEQVVRRINRKDEGGDGLADYYIEKYARGEQR